MILQRFAPSEELLPFVCGYLYARSTYPESRVLPTIPRGVPALMVVLHQDGAASLEYVKPVPTGPLAEGVYLLGQATRCWVLRVGAAQAYIVVLRPVALQALGLAAADFNDAVVPLDGVLPGCRFLAERLGAEKSQLGQLTALDAFVKRLFRNASPRADEVNGAMQRIFHAHGQVKIEALSAQERISARSLTRKFTDRVGLPPKQYAHIIRFRAVMHHLLVAPDASWLDVAHRFGYYDQSHFIKDFQHFAGRAPTQYLGVDREVDGLFVPAVAAF